MSPSQEKFHFPLSIQRQPDDTTCGPTCLHAVYQYYDHDVELADLVQEVPTLADGGTLAVLLGLHALGQGFEATLYTYNLRIFDPSWFFPRRIKNLVGKLESQVEIYSKGKRNLAASAYLEFARKGGEILMEDLSPELLMRYLGEGQPILTGTSSTWLYHAKREDPMTCVDDDEGGSPAGHFVVVHGYDSQTLSVSVSDPMEIGCSYQVPIMRLANAVLLGVLTYDANLLIIHPKS